MKLTLKNVRLSFPDLFKPVEFTKGDGKPRYNATFLIEKGSALDKEIREAIKAAATETLGAKGPKTAESWEGNPNKYAYLDGDKKEYDGYAGMMYLSCHSKTRPTVIDRDKSPLTEADGKPYAGCYVNAIVEIYVQQGEFTGVRATVKGVQFTKDGDAFGGGAPANLDDFEDLGVGEEEFA